MTLLSQPDLEPGWLGPRPGWLGLRPSWLGLRLGRLGLKPGWLGLKPTWLDVPEGGGDEQMNEWTNEQKENLPILLVLVPKKARGGY